MVKILVGLFLSFALVGCGGHVDKEKLKVFMDECVKEGGTISEVTANFTASGITGFGITCDVRNVEGGFKI